MVQQMQLVARIAALTMATTISSAFWIQRMGYSMLLE
jgi:hypothetical protein